MTAKETHRVKDSPDENYWLLKLMKKYGIDEIRTHHQSNILICLKTVYQGKAN